MGAEALAQLAVQIEAIRKAGERPVLADWKTQLQDAFQQTRTELQNVFHRAK